MRAQDTQTLKAELKANYATVILTLVTGGATSSVGKQANYAAIKAKLIALDIDWQGTNVADAAGIIGKFGTPNVIILTERPPPPFDATKALSEIQAEHGHRVTIAGVEVYLDKNQAAHQPSDQPIGSRNTTGKTKFKSGIASKQWHQLNTMNQMAQWANGLPAQLLTNGRKEYFGQGDDYFGISYEAYCQEISGVRYVSYHCYPARSKAGAQYRA